MRLRTWHVLRISVDRTAGRAEDELLDRVPYGGPQQVQHTKGVYPGVLNRVPGGEGNADLSGKMIYDFRLFELENLVDLRAADIEQIEFRSLGNVLRAAGVEVVQDDYIVPGLQIGIGDVRTDETRTPCDEDLHTFKTIALPPLVVKAIQDLERNRFELAAAVKFAYPVIAENTVVLGRYYLYH